MVWGNGEQVINYPKREMGHESRAPSESEKGRMKEAKVSNTPQVSRSAVGRSSALHLWLLCYIRRVYCLCQSLCPGSLEEDVGSHLLRESVKTMFKVTDGAAVDTRLTTS